MGNISQNKNQSRARRRTASENFDDELLLKTTDIKIDNVFFLTYIIFLQFLMDLGSKFTFILEKSTFKVAMALCPNHIKIN